MEEEAPGWEPRTHVEAEGKNGQEEASPGADLQVEAGGEGRMRRERALCTGPTGGCLPGWMGAEGLTRTGAHGTD